jgi:hypothetical protein
VCLVRQALRHSSILRNEYVAEPTKIVTKPQCSESAGCEWDKPGHVGMLVTPIVWAGNDHEVSGPAADGDVIRPLLTSRSDTATDGAAVTDRSDGTTHGAAPTDRPDRTTDSVASAG